jgi:hypothetical protein
MINPLAADVTIEREIRRMNVQRTLVFVFAVALAGAWPAASEASFASALGSRYGGTLSSNTTIRTQQLTADPVTVLRGSTSTEYDPSVVRLQNVFAEEGFIVTEAYVGVRFDGETEDLVSLGQFLEGLDFEYEETGYLQVFYQRAGESQVSALLTMDEGYTVVARGGETAGDNTHTMQFRYIAEDDTTVAKYRLYADDGARGTSPDFLVSVQDPGVMIRNIEEATVAGALIPLPAALGPGLVGLAAAVIAKRRRVA